MAQAQEQKQTTPAQKKAMLKYQAKFIEMRLRVTPEYHDEISAHARQMGESDAAFLRRAVSETMARDAGKLDAAEQSK